MIQATVEITATLVLFSLAFFLTVLLLQPSFSCRSSSEHALNSSYHFSSSSCIPSTGLVVGVCLLVEFSGWTRYWDTLLLVRVLVSFQSTRICGKRPGK